MKRAFLLLIILLIPLSLPGQETDPAAPSVPLQERYRLRELETANLEELRYLAQQAGINDQGSRENLVARLKQFYALASEESAPEESTVEDKEGLQITIESAFSSRSIQVEEKGGQEIILTGGVILNLDQVATGVVHRIFADRVVFSRITDQVTASGNIRYIRKEGEREETFTGDSLTFLLKGWKGVIYNGLSQREDEQEEQTITFFFRGEEFLNSGNDQFIMNRGTITSGNPENPTYRIKAKKIWILAPQEWGLSHGVLYIGRVPLLYMPFYYRPGNEMLFNPVMGYRNREGALIQTTTYLLGRKDSESASFFNAGLVTDESYQLERQGLFLEKGEKLETAPGPDYIKLMADYYTRLGTYAGVEGNLKGEKLKTDFRLGLAFSRSIGSDNSIYFSDGSGGWEERINESIFFGTTLPFRWQGSLQMKWTYLNLELNFLSDAVFSRDFHNRSETFDWLNWLLEERDKNQELSDGTQDSLKNRISYKRSPDVSSLSPWLQSWSINDLSLEYLMRKGTDETLELTEPENPAVYYFYPESIQSQLQMTLKGELLKWESETFQPTTGEGETEEGESDDFPGNPVLEAAEGAETLPFELKQSLTLPVDDPSVLNINWTLIPRSSLAVPYLYEDWNSQSDVDGSLDYSKWITVLDGTLSYQWVTLQKGLQLSGTNTIAGRNKEYIDIQSSLDTLSSTRQEDQDQYRQWNWSNDMTLTAYPLKNFRSWKNSTLSYTFKNEIYQWQWDQSQDQRVQNWFAFQDDMINLNKFSAHLEYLVSDILKTDTDYSYQFYPDSSRDKQDWSAGLYLTLGPFSQSFKQSASWRPDSWTSGDLVSTSRLSFFEDNLYLNEILTIDMEQRRIDKDQWTLNVWDFQAQAQLQTSTVFQWNKVSNDWESLEEAYHWETLGLRFHPDRELPPLWKNRITQKINMDLQWKMNFNQWNQNSLNLNLDYTLGIFEFMDLSLGVKSSNESMYLYFEPIREILGIQGDYNLFTDLAQSFGFFSPGQSMRYDSFFNLSDFTIDAVHYMGNWTALLEYSGHPEVESGNTLWKSTFSFVVQWSPIPSIRSRFEKDEEEEWSALTDW